MNHHNRTRTTKPNTISKRKSKTPSMNIGNYEIDKIEAKKEKTQKKKAVRMKRIDSCIDDCRKEHHGRCNNDIDEIQAMIRNMCDHAFQRDSQEEREKGCEDNEYSEVKAEDGRSKIDKQAQATTSLNETNRNFKPFQYEYNAHDIPSFQLLLNDKISFINHNESDAHPAQGNEEQNKNIAFIYKLKENLELHVNNHYLKPLRKKEKNMQCKFDNAKKQIFDSIQVLQLYHDELTKKERQYFDDLGNYRTLICSEAQDHCNAEIQKVLNLNSPSV